LLEFTNFIILLYLDVEPDRDPFFMQACVL